MNEWTGANIVNDSLTGADVRESTLAKVPDADKLDGLDSTGFVKGGTPDSCCWAKSTGKTYFNRIHTLLGNNASTILTVPHLLHITTQCVTLGDTTWDLRLRSDVGGVDVFSEGAGYPAARDTLNTGEALVLSGTDAGHLSFQAGTGADSQSGQRLVTIELFAAPEIGGCFTQFSALYQTN